MYSKQIFRKDIYIWVYMYINLYKDRETDREKERVAQSAGAVEYTDCFSVEG